MYWKNFRWLEKKLVIFAEYRRSIDNISGLLTKLKIKHVILDGRQKDKRIWRKFQNDNSIQIIICQYQSASEGVDLYAADTIIYYEPTLSSNILEQSRIEYTEWGRARNAATYILLLKERLRQLYTRLLKVILILTRSCFLNT